MIAFGTIVMDPEASRRYAGPGIARTAEAGAVVHTFCAVGAVGRGYNLLLDAAKDIEDLEAFVLVHPHCEIDDPEFQATVRAALADPDVAVVGSAGAGGVRGVAWWEGDDVVMGPTVHRFVEMGGGDLPAFAWTNPRPGPAEVDAVDGYLMALSPWAVRNLRFDEDLWIGLGWDADYCRRAREAGKKVVVANLRTIWHRSLDLIGEPGLFSAGQIQGYFRAIIGEARILDLEAELAELEASPGWALTRPLRVLNHRRRARNGSPPSR
jgi:hypothetical protein